ncbi:DUF2505 domain-containing protein [Nocardioides sp. NPDC127514]|uniref:DUF2505 domain-containing protein n=1 Tax=unclassified Nocardioides TaxID=2615069 RepID=UPI003321B636
MPTSLSIVQPFPVPPDQVYALLRDPNWVAESAQATNGPDALVRLHEEDGDELRIVTESPIPAASIPAGLRPLLANGAVGTKTERWTCADGGYRGEFKIAVPGTPATVRVVAELVSEVQGSRLTLDGTSSVKIPALGPKIEKLVIDQARDRLTAEYEFMCARLV